MLVSAKGDIYISWETAPEIMAEFTTIIEAVYERLTDDGYSDELAREMIAHAGQLAFMSDKELEETLKEKEKEFEEFSKDHE